VRYNRKSGYKLMSSMAHFHPDYKLLDDLVLNEAENEAVSLMDFSAANTGGTFAAHPAYVDAITQVAGFAMNAKDETDIDNEVFVNHGWKGFQIYQNLEKGKTYEVYTKMHKEKGSEFAHGDVVVFHGNDVVAFFEQLSVSCGAPSRPEPILFASLFLLEPPTNRSCSFAPSLAKACVLSCNLPLIEASGIVAASPPGVRRPNPWPSQHHR